MSLFATVKKDPRTSIRVFITLELAADHIDAHNEKGLFLRNRGGRSNKNNKLLDVLQAHTLPLVPRRCSTTETARWLSKTFELEEHRRAVLEEISLLHTSFSGTVGT